MDFPQKRYISLDVGDATIGVAVSDLLLITAQGVETIRRNPRAPEKDFERLVELSRQFEARDFVVGYPRNMNGSEGSRCEFVKEFSTSLKEFMPEANIIFWDERLSTVAAAKSLIAADVSRAKRKRVIDKMAAVYILQGYLDSLPKG